jgi:ADP-heptose:LPS heptosyltransferase
MAGFYPAGGKCPDQKAFLPWDDREHEVLRMLRLMKFLGIPNRGEALEFPVRESDKNALESGVQNLPAPGTYVCIHPGARMRTRRWPAERFAQVADRFARQGMPIVLTGSADEAALVGGVRSAMKLPALDLSGRTDLGALAALVSRAALVVCNDTGISHVAAAVDTPSVVICSGSDPERWSPLNVERHRVLAHPVECRPCMYLDCPIGHPCAMGVSVDMVAAQAEELLWAKGARTARNMSRESIREIGRRSSAI